MDILQLFRAAAQAANSVAAGPDDTPSIVWQTFGPWITRLMSSAAVKWLPRLAAQIPCEVPLPPSAGGGPCPRLAVAACDICQRPVCLAHARVDYAGDAICLECVARIVQERAQQQSGYAPPPPMDDEGPRRPPPRPIDMEELRAAYRLLGLKRRSTDEEVRRAHRQKSAKLHPDLHPGREKQAEARFKEVQVAYDLIMEERRRRAA